jgi:hypothetical protein
VGTKGFFLSRFKLSVAFIAAATGPATDAASIAEAEKRIGKKKED